MAMTMTDKVFNMVWSEAQSSEDRDAFASEWALSSIWGEPDEDELVKIAQQCGKIWDVAHMSYPELLKQSGMTNAEFSVRFCIPRRTAQHWASGTRSCPQWCILGFARQLGLI